MNKKGGHVSIQMKMIIRATAVLIVSLLLLSYLYFVKFRSIYEQEVEMHMKDVTTVSAGSVSDLSLRLDQLSVFVLIDEEIQNSLRELNSVSAEISGRNVVYLTERIARKLRTNVYNNPGVLSVRVLSNEGDEIYVGAVNEEYNFYSISVEEMREANGAAVWKYLEGDTFVSLGRAILDTGTMLPIGSLVINCKTEYFEDLLGTIPYADQGMLYLCDADGRIIASNNDTDEKTVLSAEEKLVLAGEVQRLKNAEGTRYYHAGNPLENGWYLVCTVSAETLMKGERQVLIWLSVIILLVFAAGFLLFLLSSRRIMEPINRLEDTMEHFATGDLTARYKGCSHDEVERIGGAFNQMADSLQNLYEKVYALELANKEAQIEFLKMQINPHFLYNALDAISWMGFDTGNEEISEFATSLARILRASVSSPDMITVSKEMDVLQNYLYIQKTRFGDKIDISVHVDPETEECLMPSFLLQPLAENSFQHGLEKLNNAGKLEVKVERKGEELVFSVLDNGVGMTQERLDEIRQRLDKVKHGSQTAEGTVSIGLANVYRRLRLIYEDKLEFHIESNKESGTQIVFKIPAQTVLEGEQK